MAEKQIDVVVAGHICLDIIPQLSSAQNRPEDLFVPGGLVNVGPATVALGGCVANTGLALHRLGAATRLVGKVGDDLLGATILESLRQYDAALPESMVVAAGEATSYTIVLSPPNVDRGFLHCPGANNTFVARDLAAGSWRGARILHFGYPPLMRGIAAEEGRGLAVKFSEVRAAGTLVSLDMAMPPAGAEERVDWARWLRNVLPHVDVFLPSLDEIMQMLAAASDSDRGDGAAAAVAGDVGDALQLTRLSDELLAMGVPIVVIKLGELGLYLRTGDTETLRGRESWRAFNWSAWRNRELLTPCWEVDVVGTTGAGDCTIAGFLQAMLHGATPEDAVCLATTVGAHCVQSADATSNIPPWSEVTRASRGGWKQRESALRLSEWRQCGERGPFRSPADCVADVQVR